MLRFRLRFLFPRPANVRVVYLRWVMFRHLVDSLLVYGNCLVQAALVCIQAAQMQKCGYLGGLMSARVLQTRAVQSGALAVHRHSVVVAPSPLQQLCQVQMRHCVEQAHHLLP